MGINKLMTHNCTILVLGHLPSPDNLNGLRSRDIDIDPRTARRWRSQIKGSVPLLRCFARLVSVTYCPTSLRHAHSAKLLTRLLEINDPIEDARLNNIDYGVHKGHALEHTPSRAAMPDLPYEGGESWYQVAARWREFCAERLPKHDAGVVLLAGQSGTAPRMLRHICDGISLVDAVTHAVPHVPFFSATGDIPNDGLVWRYIWAPN